MVTYPEEWNSCQIKDCVDIYQGGTPDTGNEKYWNGNVIWVTPGEITKLNGLYINDSERRITEEGLRNSSAIRMPIGTILLCTRATIGELAIALKPMSTNQGFKNLVCKDGVNNVYFAYLLLTLKNEMLIRAIGTTFLEISKKELSSIPITIPPSAEQSAIARVLSDIDDHIANLTGLIEKKKWIREGAILDLVSGQTRLEGFEDKWMEMTIGGCAEIRQGGTPNTSNDRYWNGDIVWITPSEITKSNTLYICNSERKITEEGQKNSSAVMLPAGAILLCTRATIGDLAIAEIPLTTNQGFKNLICKKNVDPMFFAYLLMTKKTEFILRAIGTTFLELSKTELSSIKVLLPSIEEQIEIAKVLSAMDEEISALEAEKEKMIQIREGAMDDLLTGRVRLPVEGE